MKYIDLFEKEAALLSTTKKVGLGVLGTLGVGTYFGVKKVKENQLKGKYMQPFHEKIREFNIKHGL